MIRFGVAGVPLAFHQTEYRKNRVHVLRWLAGLGLNACELQMTYGPRTKPDVCRQYRDEAAEYGIRLSVHAAYYIVLTANDSAKINQSIDTLLRTYELCDVLGGTEVILHPGPLYGLPDAEVLPRFIDHAGQFLQRLGACNIGLFVETAGKVGQLGSVDDILAMSAALDGVHPCIDFGHVHARTLGGLNTPAAIDALVDKLACFSQQHPSKRLHFHYTPIHWGPKGEIQHRAVHDTLPAPLQHNLWAHPAEEHYHPRPLPVAHALARLPGDFTVISETHNSQEQGALALKHALVKQP